MSNVKVQMRTGRVETYEVDEANRELVLSQLRLDLRVDSIKFENTDGEVIYILMQAVRLIQVEGQPAELADGTVVEGTVTEGRVTGTEEEGYDSGEE